MNSVPSATFSGAVAIVGAPNVGKSTLLNRIIGKKISIVSHKPQTTQGRILGILTRADRQIIFIDTPGIGKPLGKLASHLNRVAENARYEADFIVAVLDASKGLRDIDLGILEGVAQARLPVFAVINKMDLSTNERTIPLVSTLSGRFGIEEFFPVSAKTGDGLERLVDGLLKRLPENPHIYEPHEQTDQTPESVVAEFVREQIFLNAEQELPYSIMVKTEEVDIEGEIVRAAAVIYGLNARHRKILIGD
ncbi:MAG: GTPase Era, partial [Candidatus Raymondbacteria bacterium RIFOXYA2_FULL_49_16]